MNQDNLDYYKVQLIKFVAEDIKNTTTINDRIKGIQSRVKDKKLTFTDKEIRDKLDKKNNLVKKKITLLTQYINEYNVRKLEEDRQKLLDDLVNEVLPDLEYADNIDIALEKLFNK